jgi:hypothetical protein
MYSISKENNDDISEELLNDEYAPRKRTNTFDLTNIQDLVSDYAPDTNDDISQIYYDNDLIPSKNYLEMLLANNPSQV